MNNSLQQYARQTLKDGLDKLPTEWHRTFKRMYARDDSVPIHEVVDKMPADKLDWAMQQVDNSLRKIEKSTVLA